MDVNINERCRIERNLLVSLVRGMVYCSSRALQCLKTPQIFPATIRVGKNTGACIITISFIIYSTSALPQNLLLNWRVFLVLKINFHPCFLFFKLEYFSTPFPLQEELQFEQYDNTGAKDDTLEDSAWTMTD
jgi:hypothetical protein